MYCFLWYWNKYCLNNGECIEEALNVISSLKEMFTYGFGT